MGELLKLIWDAIILRDSARKGMLSWRVFAFAAVFVLLLYGTGLSAVIDYQKHPSHKPLFIAAMIFDLLLFLAFLSWGIRRWLRRSGDKIATAKAGDL